MTTQSPLVSVIVPVYNTAEYLPDCVESVLHQTYPTLEVLLVDDGSTDSSGSRCDAYALSDPRVRVVHQDNAGLSEARNTGLKHASGQWVMFLDSDDWIDPDCLAVLIDLVREEKAHVALCGTARVSEPVEAEASAGPVETLVLSGDDFLRNPTPYLPVHPVSACAKLIRRELLEGVRFPPGRLHEDVFVTHVILHRARRVALTRRALHFYRQRPGSITAGTMSLRSASDKARAHLSRARDLEGYGLSDVAGLEFRRGLGWHLRVDRLIRRRADAQAMAELAEQRALILRGPGRPALTGRTRLTVSAYSVAPRMVAWLYAAALRLTTRGLGSHPIKGERTAL